MAHKEQKQFCEWVKERHPEFFNNRSVVEIGSKNINGSIRDLFYKCRYIGIDLEEGPGVDIVENYANYEAEGFLKEKVCMFDVVCSCESLEHDRSWLITMKRMFFALKPGGLLLITAAGNGREEHGTWNMKPNDSPNTKDYYKNISNEMAARVLNPTLFTTFYMNQCPINNDFQFFGIKAY